ncbi:hypothetical protein FIBSPDRAFT_282590 [Athelia psychrophila]|uniref:Uncharacterized protein n=1 Tax=Athelia psychrophila TaxID=1759441 RepID=A0A166R2Q2_9AGAM|nr:hypothetical protein FIBSPDRAFT_282590 [Fibularhizoctonia sp. CBS 109695]
MRPQRAKSLRGWLEATATAMASTRATLRAILKGTHGRGGTRAALDVRGMGRDVTRAGGDAAARRESCRVREAMISATSTTAADFVGVWAAVGAPAIALALIGRRLARARGFVSTAGAWLALASCNVARSVNRGC